MSNLLIRAQKELKNRKYKKAAYLFDKIISENSENLVALVGLAESFYYLQQYPKSEEILQRVLVLDSKNVRANLLLGYICLQKGDIEQSFVIAKYTIDIAPDFGEANGFLGAILAIKNQFEDAIIYLDKAASLDSSDWFSCFYLGYSYLKINQRQKSRYFLWLAFKLRPSFKLLSLLVEGFGFSIKYLLLGAVIFLSMSMLIAVVQKNLVLQFGLISFVLFLWLWRIFTYADKKGWIYFFLTLLLFPFFYIIYLFID
jgi:tetratricopeptide (TPR) repeat protein